MARTMIGARRRHLAMAVIFLVEDRPHPRERLGAGSRISARGRLSGQPAPAVAAHPGSPRRCRVPTTSAAGFDRDSRGRPSPLCQLADGWIRPSSSSRLQRWARPSAFTSVEFDACSGRPRGASRVVLRRGDDFRPAPAPDGERHANSEALRDCIHSAALCDSFSEPCSSRMRLVSPATRWRMSAPCGPTSTLSIRSRAVPACAGGTVAIAADTAYRTGIAPPERGYCVESTLALVAGRRRSAQAASTQRQIPAPERPQRKSPAVRDPRGHRSWHRSPRREAVRFLRIASSILDLWSPI